ncbi:MAG: amidase [Woeseiaceae bacterium]|nr:amidase [Woeseiaceae bacterium]
MTQLARTWLTGLLLVLAAACSRPAVDFSEATIAELHDRMHRGEVSSEQLVGWYLDRIEAIDAGGPELRSIIEVNPDALTIARALDEEWAESGPRGPLHGIPVVLKANIDTADRMFTTAGSLALEHHRPPEDAFLVSRLRDAGAVILGKANLSEWANFRSDRSSSGWSSIGGQTRNPYHTARNPCGSSSGSAVAVAANLTMVAVGTETNGSIVCPAGANGIVGIKPSLGLVSRAGIIPIAHSQDTAGPMARTVRDAALLLGAMTGADPRDPLAAGFPRDAANQDFTANLAADALADRRIGVIRNYYGAGSHPGVEKVLEDSIAALEAAGVTIVDDITLEVEGMYDASGTVLDYEFKADLAAYFETSGAPFETLADVIAYNEAHAETVMPWFGQERMLAANEAGGLDDAEYLDALAESKRISQSAIDAALAEHGLDALIAPTNGPAWMTDLVNGDSFHVSSSSFAAISGYPNVTVPAGFVHGLPVNVSFVGPMNGDKALIELAHAFEQATASRRPPDLAQP